MKTKYFNEGLVIIFIGIFFGILSLKIPANPVVLKSWVNVLAQAKLIPLFVSILLIAFGFKLMMQIAMGNLYQVKAGIQDKRNLIIVLVLTLAYLISIIYFGFKIPTIAYLTTIILVLNRKIRTLPIMVTYIVLYCFITLYIVPMVINIRLP